MRTHDVGLCGVAALLGLLSGTPAQGQDQAFQIEELSPGIWAALVVPNPPMYVFSNALIIEQEDGLGVVGSHSSPSAARALIRRIMERSDKPVRWLVNTHFHSDHVYGNEAYVARFPEVRIIAQENTARDIDLKTRPFIQQEIAEFPATIAQRKEWIRTREGPSGEALTNAQVRRLERSARLRAAQLEELKGMELKSPTETFRTEMSLPDTSHPVRLLYFGPAHTEGDAVVYLPNQKILAVGDLLEDGLPWVDENTHVVGWADALDEMAKLDIDIVLPAHGGLFRGTDLLERQQAFFRYVVDSVRLAHDRGDSLETAQALIDAADVPKPLEPGHRALQAGWEEYVRGVIAHTYAELVGGP
jgi:cyclase